VKQDAIKSSQCLCNEETGAEFILNNKDYAGTYLTPVRVMVSVGGQKMIVEDNIQWAIKKVPPIEISS
jgi:uncharacterized protein YlzI (FlbEa/FlbD family)